jgi:hypothetical protein
MIKVTFASCFSRDKAKTRNGPENGPDPIGSGRKRSPYDFDTKKTRKGVKRGEIEFRNIFATYIIAEEGRNQRGGQARARWSRLAPFSRLASLRFSSSPSHDTAARARAGHAHTRAPNDAVAAQRVVRAASVSLRASTDADAASARGRAAGREACKRARLRVGGSSRMYTYGRGVSARLSWLARTLISRASFVRRPVLARSRRPSSTSTLARDVYAVLAARVHARRCVRDLPCPAPSLPPSPAARCGPDTHTGSGGRTHTRCGCSSARSCTRCPGSAPGAFTGTQPALLGASASFNAHANTHSSGSRLGARDDVRGPAPAKTAARRSRRADRRGASVCLS